MPKEISALDLRKHFGEIIEEVRYRKEPYIVKRNGRPMVVLVDVEAYQASKQRLDEEAFIEEYTDERVKEFLREDKMDPGTRDEARRFLGR